MTEDDGWTPLREKADPFLAAHANAVPLPESVYHYTSLRALIPIAETGKVWASNVRYSNDPAEISYGDELLRGMLKDKFSDFFLKGLFEQINEIHYYAVAFSAEPDLLPQWRAYCQNGHGVAIGFSAQPLASHTSMLFRRIEYAPQVQMQLASDIMNVYADPIRQAPDDAARFPLLGELALYFVVLRGMFKQRAYVGEAEYRLFNTLPRPRHAHDTSLLFRATKSAVIPYYEVDLSRNRATCGKIPMTEVMLGPCLDSSLAEESVRVLLDQSQLEYVKITPSKVRMRSE